VGSLLASVLFQNSEISMKKALIALVASASLLAAGSAVAQVGKAASEATDSARHRIDQKRAEQQAEKSGPVGKAVNKAKSGYHKNRSSNSAEKAKDALTPSR
jgi:hypothetical protein